MAGIRGVSITLNSIKREFNRKVETEVVKIIDKAVVALAEATPVDTGEARDGWRREGLTIVNDVEHIVQLNEGSSKQAPTHFIEETLLQQPGVKSNGIIVTVK